jgi:hypothetical protein
VDPGRAHHRSVDVQRHGTAARPSVPHQGTAGYGHLR